MYISRLDSYLTVAQAPALYELSKRAAARLDANGLSYHNSVHVGRMLDTLHWYLDSEKVKDVDVATMCAAILYHDVVYIPGYTQNEEVSVLALKYDVQKLVNARLVGSKVQVRGEQLIDYEDSRRLILATKVSSHLANNEPSSLDEDLIRDLDLCSLGSMFSSFVRTQFRIAQEQDPSLTNLRDWQLGDIEKSREFLKVVAAKDNIFRLQFFRSKFEGRARENIAKFANYGMSDE